MRPRPPANATSPVRPAACAALLLACCVALAAAPARAGVIIPASAAGTLTLSNDADTQVTPLTFPAAAPFVLVPTTLAGGSVTGAYAFTEGPTDVLHVEATSRAERGGARVQVTFTFTTALDALYSFSATANGPTGFLGSLDAITAVRNQTPPDFGNIPPAGTLLLSGFLPAGTHTYAIDAVQAPSPHAPFFTIGQFDFTVTLTPAGNGAVPLPAAAWLALPAAALAARAGRRRRRTKDEGRRQK